VAAVGNGFLKRGVSCQRRQRARGPFVQFVPAEMDWLPARAVWAKLARAAQVIPTQEVLCVSPRKANHFARDDSIDALSQWLGELAERCQQLLEGGEVERLGAVGLGTVGLGGFRETGRRRRAPRRSWRVLHKDVRLESLTYPFDSRTACDTSRFR